MEKPLTRESARKEGCGSGAGFGRLSGSASSEILDIRKVEGGDDM